MTTVVSRYLRVSMIDISDGSCQIRIFKDISKNVNCQIKEVARTGQISHNGNEEKRRNTLIIKNRLIQ